MKVCALCKKNEALLSVYQTTDAGRTVAIPLCASCASKAGLLRNSDQSAKIINSLYAAIVERESMQKTEYDSFCPCCGSSLSAFVKEQRLGCPECYRFFQYEIAEVFFKAGIPEGYAGEKPAHRLARSVLSDKVDLEAKLADALLSEEYEEAAYYRDQLKALEDVSHER